MIAPVWNAPERTLPAALALGCASIGSTLTPLNRRESIDLIDSAFDMGVRHFDTASIYGRGDSEHWLGEALRRRRSQVVLASKAGQMLSTRLALLSRLKTPVRWASSRHCGLHQRLAAQRAQGVRRCFDADFIEHSLRASLKRLGTNYLDIFYLHSPDADVLAQPELIERIEVLRREGLFRAFGVSCDDEATAWRAASHDAVQIVQFAFEDDPSCNELLHEIAGRGKQAVLRGLMQHHREPSAAPLAEVLRRTMELPAVAGMIIGTANAAHLRTNVDAYAQALRVDAA